jgi:RND family efflux transporter MFP subunit
MASAATYLNRAASDPRIESIAWARFSAARDDAEFWGAWLAILCGQIERVEGALLLLGPDATGSFTPAAIWPDHTLDLQHLGVAARRALEERRGVVVAADGISVPARDQAAHVGYPIEVAGTLHGVVVLEIAPGQEAGLQRALRTLHWSSAWLVDHVRKRALADRDTRLGRVGLVMELVAAAVQQRRFAAAVLAVANDLADRLACDRVSIGFEHNGTIRVQTMSDTATFDARTALVRAISEAMEESLDLQGAIVHPPAHPDEPASPAHDELAHMFRDVAICSVPLLDDGHAVGVITLQRGRGEAFDSETLELCRTAGAALGPVFVLQRDNERSAWRRLVDQLRELARALLGPRHPGAKLIALSAVAIVLLLSFTTTTWRVSAKTVVEGAVQRAAVAPFDGHIAQSMVRAGDTVVAGQVLCRLDDRDLRLERLKLSSEREQLLRRHRQALAAQERAQMAVLSAEIAEIDAQIDLVEDKLARATLTAPFDGVVVSGDLHQLLGAPVEQGKLLFQITPLDRYRIILDVDERDIASVELGQPGQLNLSGLPGEHLNFEVRQITSVSTQQDGRNYFRVEAQLPTPSEHVRPGMEGVGKIAIGERRLIWIWTHGLVDWLRTWAWKQLP